MCSLTSNLFLATSEESLSAFERSFERLPPPNTESPCSLGQYLQQNKRNQKTSTRRKFLTSVTVSRIRLSICVLLQPEKKRSTIINFFHKKYQKTIFSVSMVCLSTGLRFAAADPLLGVVPRFDGGGARFDGGGAR